MILFIFLAFNFFKKKQKVLKLVELDIHKNFTKQSKELKHLFESIQSQIDPKVDLLKSTLVIDLFSFPKTALFKPCSKIC